MKYKICKYEFFLLFANTVEPQPTNNIFNVCMPKGVRKNVLCSLYPLENFLWGCAFNIQQKIIQIQKLYFLLPC